MSLLAGVAGFRGYSGADLVRLLARHPHAEPVLLDHRHDATLAALPVAGGRSFRALPLTQDSIRHEGIQAVFLATPPEVSIELARPLLDAGARVIDLSGAFRLGTATTYKRWYGEEHGDPGLLEEAVYGLPQFYPDRIRAARLLSNPGCYPTAANLALRPLVEAGLIDRSAGIVCDAKSGVSGAGRKPSLKTSFCEVTENFSAYSVLQHRHVPEVLGNSGLEEAEFSFTAHLLPVDRGILETIYFRAAKGVTAEQILDAYRTRYAGDPFVRIYPEGHFPDLRAVARTNHCDLGVKLDAATGRAVVVSAIDNLVKGAAGQALENFNLMFGFEHAAGLL